jgi:hypothetical protein
MQAHSFRVTLMAPLTRRDIPRKKDIMTSGPIRAAIRRKADAYVRAYCVVVEIEYLSTGSDIGSGGTTHIATPTESKATVYVKGDAPMWLHRLLDNYSCGIPPSMDTCDAFPGLVVRRTKQLAVDLVTAMLEATYGRQLELPF